jgi:Icc protein
MPIHLPPVSRRRFLASSLVAGAGLMFQRNLFAAEKPVDERSWVLFSDPHIAADSMMVHGDVNMTENFKIAGREVMGLPQRPAGFFLNGDCAFNSGEVADYSALSGLLKPIRKGQIPICLTLGNHDNRDHFWTALKMEKALPHPVADHQVALVETPHANWIVLDSLEQTLSTPGLLGPAQLDWLAHSLDAHPDKPALVMVHHNPSFFGGHEKTSLKDTAELLAVLRPRKQVKALIFGHTHVWQNKTDDSGIQLINLPPVGFVFAPGRPSGWVHARLKDEGIRLELRCQDQTHPQHGQVVELPWRAA